MDEQNKVEEEVKEKAEETIEEEVETQNEAKPVEEKAEEPQPKDDKNDKKNSSFFKNRKDKEIEELKEKVELLQDEVNKTKNLYYKAYADTENLKKRLQSESDTVRKYRAQGFVTEILPALDNLERALAVETESEEMKNYMSGINMIYQMIMTALEREGVKAIEAKDKPFDPNFHQALVQEKVEGVESGIVLEEIQKGYVLKDRVIRATLVKVSE